MAGDPAQLRHDWRLPAADRFGPNRPGYAAAIAAHEAAVDAGDPGYLDPMSGLFVMTAVELASRACCTQGCRHCPWQRHATGSA